MNHRLSQLFFRFFRWRHKRSRKRQAVQRVDESAWTVYEFAATPCKR